MDNFICFACVGGMCTPWRVASVTINLWVFFSVSGPLRSCWYLACALVPSSSRVEPLARVSTLSVCPQGQSSVWLSVCLSVPRVSPLSVHQSEPWMFCWWSVCVRVLLVAVLMLISYGAFGQGQYSVCLSTGSVLCLSVCPSFMSVLLIISLCVCCLLPSWCWSPMEPLARSSSLSVCLSRVSPLSISQSLSHGCSVDDQSMCVLLVALLMLISHGAFGQVQ